MRYRNRHSPSGSEAHRNALYRLQDSRRATRKANGITSAESGRTYTGRFAPSPTGPLHLGSLFTALASFLQARSQNGQWRLRIDDLDTPRNMPGAADAILKTLDNFGLHWDGEVIYQSRQNGNYRDAIAQLAAEESVYRCVCTRKFLAHYQQVHPEKAHLYPGVCRNAAYSTQSRHALRVKTGAQTIRFEDALQGVIEQSLSAQHGDFIVLRRDNIVAYQLAAAVDDRKDQITEVVRGYDLLESTPKQLYLQQLLKYSPPRYMHVPILVDAHGQKLSKQSYAEAVDRHDPKMVLFEILTLLQQHPPRKLHGAPSGELLSWAIAHWNPESLKGRRVIRIREGT